jgi:prepilin-type N-terminal cleavage/methylation domain-containing protein/prepilin-type processing-associated H-X9-DG protein
MNYLQHTSRSVCFDANPTASESAAYTQTQQKRGPAMNASRNHSTRNSSGGFTLIEVLVVISIISLLISLMLPSLKKSRDTALALRDSSNLRQVGYGLLRYQNDYRDWVLGYRMPRPADGQDMAVWWSIAIANNYIEGNSAGTGVLFSSSGNPAKDTLPPIRCIADTPARFVNSLVRKPYADMGGTNYINPGASGNSRFWVSYTFNGFMGDAGSVALMPLQRVSRITKAPSSLIYATCGDQSNRIFTLAGWNAANMFVHDETTNTLFLDGHIERIKKDFITDIEQLKP